MKVFLYEWDSLRSCKGRILQEVEADFVGGDIILREPLDIPGMVWVILEIEDGRPLRTRLPPFFSKFSGKMLTVR